jgi:P4 family phage/plasmid primase-like protien
MSSIDLNQARQYIELLRGDSESVVCWQLFNDEGLEKHYAQVFHSSLSDAITRIQLLQNQGYGAYITINPTDGTGRKIENIVSYDWAFADVDGELIPESYPLAPAFISRRDDTHGHIYWPIEGCLTEKQYNAVQMRIALYLDSDRQVVDPARVARVCGFLHLKEPTNPQKYYISHNNDIDFNYTIEEIEDAFTLSVEQEKLLSEWLTGNESNSHGTGINDNPIYRSQFVEFIKNNAPIAVEGSGSLTVYKVSLYGYDRGLSSVEAQTLMWEHYNQRCDPPWEEKDKSKFYQYVKNAWKFAKNTGGCDTATAKFSKLAETSPVLDPAGGWDANEKLAPEHVEPVLQYVEPTDKFGFISASEGAANVTMLNSKVSVTDAAYAFIGSYYPDKTLIRNSKVFYVFNGVHWREVSDDLIKNQIAKMVSSLKFPPSKINNIYQIVEMTMYQDNIRKGDYMTTQGKKGIHSFIMQNGIVEIQGKKVKLIPHNRDLFDLNALSYDYNPDAKCPEFLQFVNDQWPDDPLMHDQLQELYGLTLVSESKFHLLPLMVGKTRSGKGTHAAIMTEMLGKENVCSPNLESLIEDHMMHTMSAKKLAIIPEANALHPSIKNRVLNRLKSITGGDNLTFNRKYQASDSTDKWPIVIVQSNELPEFADGSGAYGNRVWPFHFKRSFAGKEDRELVKKLTTPDSISGIHAWAVRGLVRILTNGVPTKAKSSVEMIDEIKYDTFPLSSFVEEFCDYDESGANANDWVYVDELYDFYLIHCKHKNQRTPFTPQKFTRILKSSSLNVHKERESSTVGVRRKYIFRGIKKNEFMAAKHKPDRMPAVSYNNDITNHIKPSAT